MTSESDENRRDDQGPRAGEASGAGSPAPADPLGEEGRLAGTEPRTGPGPVEGLEVGTEADLGPGINDPAWLKKTLSDVLGEDRPIPDFMIDKLRKFGPSDLDELRQNEREAALSAFARVARQSRDARGGELGEAEGRPAYTEGDIEWGLRAAAAALESVPAGKRSTRAIDLLANCECPSAVGPNPGLDPRTAGGRHDRGA